MGASTNYTENRQSKSAHKHSSDAWKNVAVIPVRLKHIQSSMRSE